MVMATVIITVLNEAETIVPLLEALKHQTHSPAAVIITDGGSHDETLQRIKAWQSKNKQFPLTVMLVKGNRSVGRNRAIEKVTTELIAITDAGCVPEPDWLEKLLQKHAENNAPVVAGYYRAVTTTPFTQAAAPYFLVMPDRVDPATFLPATRSMLILKSAWEKVGKFDENLPDNEDYVFAHKLREQGIKIAFAREAIVEWQPPTSLPLFAKTVYRFAHGDVSAGILRPKVAALFGRYLVAILLLGFLAQIASYVVIPFLVTGLLGYLFWAILKNKRYVHSAWPYLPVLQLTADAAVMSGSLMGLLSLLFSRSRLK